MKTTWNTLLIDDDSHTNLFHTILLRKVNEINVSKVFQDAQKALQFLKSESNLSNTKIIFLDLNMNGMDGWEFMEEFEKSTTLDGPKIVLLTSSLNPDDINKSKSFPSIIDYQSKPVSPKYFAEFPEKFNSVLTLHRPTH